MKTMREFCLIYSWLIVGLGVYDQAWALAAWDSGLIFNQTQAAFTCPMGTRWVENRWAISRIAVGSDCDAASARDICLAYYVPNILDANPGNRSRDAGFIKIKIPDTSVGNCQNVQSNIRDPHYLGVKSNVHLDGILATQCIEMIDDATGRGECVSYTDVESGGLNEAF